MTMKNKKLLKYFTEQILPILDEIEFNDTEQECESVTDRELYKILHAFEEIIPNELTDEQLKSYESFAYNGYLDGQAESYKRERGVKK